MIRCLVTGDSPSFGLAVGTRSSASLQAARRIESPQAPWFKDTRVASHGERECGASAPTPTAGQPVGCQCARDEGGASAPTRPHHNPRPYSRRVSNTFGAGLNHRYDSVEGARKGLHPTPHHPRPYNDYARVVMLYRMRLNTLGASISF